MTHTPANGLEHLMHILKILPETCKRQFAGLWHLQSNQICLVSPSSHCPCLRGPTQPTQQFLEHPLTHKVARIPRQAIQMQRPTAWSDGKYPIEHPRQDILLFIVANTLGIHEYLDGMQLVRGLQDMMAQTGKTFDFTIPAATHHPYQKVYPPRGFEAANRT